VKTPSSSSKSNLAANRSPPTGPNSPKPSGATANRFSSTSNSKPPSNSEPNPITQLSPKARQKLGLQLAINEQKIGGAPHWVQTGERAPTDFKLLLQLSNFPVTDDFSADNERMLNPNFNFGTGTGYAMINAAATEGVLLWECD
jgi:hypothetical protein